jgi:hypothetical protein
MQKAIWEIEVGLLTKKMEKSKKEKIRIILDIILMVIFILWSFQIAQSYRDCSLFLCGSNSTVYCKEKSTTPSFNLTNDISQLLFCNKSAEQCPT